MKHPASASETTRNGALAVVQPPHPQRNTISACTSPRSFPLPARTIRTDSMQAITTSVSCRRMIKQLLPLPAVARRYFSRSTIITTLPLKLRTLPMPRGLLLRASSTRNISTSGQPKLLRVRRGQLCASSTFWLRNRKRRRQTFRLAKFLQFAHPRQRTSSSRTNLAIVTIPDIFRSEMNHGRRIKVEITAILVVLIIILQIHRRRRRHTLRVPVLIVIVRQLRRLSSSTNFKYRSFFSTRRQIEP